VAVWLNEIFDNYNNGVLSGQGAWTTSGTVSAQVQSNVAKADRQSGDDGPSSFGQTIGSRVTFDSKNGGYHFVTLDVCQDAAGTTGN